MSHLASFKTGIAAAFTAALTLAFAAAPAGAEPKGDPGALAALGSAAILALRAGGADDAVDRVSESLALVAAQKRIQAEAEDAAAAAARADSPPAGATGGAEHEHADAVPDGYGEGGAAVAIDPRNLPPASAGSNGTEVQRHHSNLGREDIFAHTAAADPENSAILLTGVALAPPHAPEAVRNVINNANTIVGRPYVWGGGHGSFYSHGYDCSGAVSFALFGGGLIPRPLTSGELESWGAPGPGKWITVYANPGHTFATIAGLRWDTVGDAQGTGPRWHLAPTSTEGFVVRHPPGL